MAIVARANVILNIEDEEDVIQHYLGMGYNLIDDAGVVLRKSIPTSLGELQMAYVEHLKKIEELEDTVAKLTAKSVKKSTKKSEE